MRIKNTSFDGLKAIELKTSRVRLILVTEIGPRVAHLSSIRGKSESRNLLFWDFKKKYLRKDWMLRGGHRVWGTRPGADEAEETYAPDNAACEVRIGKNGLTALAPEISSAGIRKSLSIKVLDDATFQVENVIKNTGDMLWSGGVWALTCTLPSKSCTYGIPLGDGSEWDAFAIVTSKRWGGHSSLVNDPQVSVNENNMVIVPKGRECKRMVQAPQGLMGMTDAAERISFLKHSPYERVAQYPLNCNISFYIGPKNFMVEMESMGPEKTLRPGEIVRNVETWGLRDPVDWKTVKKVVL